MNLVLESVRLRLAAFELRADVTIARRVTAVFGPSGSGKTSLVELIAGVRGRHAGVVRLGGRVLADAAAGIFVPPENRAIGYVPQDGALFPHLNVQANLLFGRHARQVYAGPLSLEHVTEVLEIDRLLGRAVGDLSGGEKQRVALGRALLASPQVLLLDEPLAGLDAPLRDRLLPYLERVRDEFKIPMIYISHSPDEIVALCEDVVMLERGEIVRQGSPREIFVPSTKTRFEVADRFGMRDFRLGGDLN